jgi:hypothetical protein
MPTVNDGNVPYGSFNVTIGSTSYVAETISTDQGSTVIERRNALNEPSGQVIIPDFETGSFTIQRPASTAALPAIGTIALFPTNADVSGTHYVNQVGRSYSQGDVQKFNISVRKAVAS